MEGTELVLFTLEVGSRGVINLSGFHQLKKELRVSSRDFSRFLAHVLNIAAISESFKICCRHNTALSPGQ